MQGGVGFRMEDRFAIGRPDMVMVPKDLPVFFVEAKTSTDHRIPSQ